MKKFYTTFFLTVLFALVTNAQNLNTIVFVDKNGNEIANGSTLSANTAVEDDFGDIQIHSGLFVKNLTTTEVGVRIHFSVQTIENGMFQICFPVTCITKTVAGNYETGSDLMAGGEQRDLQTEWTPQSYGQCTVTYQIELMKQLSGFPPQFESLEMGPEITVNYSYSDQSGIDAVTQGSQTNAITYYSADGRQLKAPQSGVNIVRLSNGKVVKVYRQ
mgnify:CR=1 FL=1